MRKLLITGLVTLSLGGAVAGAWAADEQAPPPPPAPGMEGPAHGPDGGMMGWMHAHMMHRRMAAFALVYPAEDRKLGVADVQKIAEAFLLWNGNHAWKVTEVTQNQDNTVSFAYATQEGSVVARFSMDSRTGRVRRLS